jgi:hypothetical protein
MSKYYFYKLTHDNGGAPCIDGNLLSLAICKPMIRSTAEVDNIILGFAANSLHSNNRLLYVARVTKKLVGGDYFKSAAYRHRADCIYFWRSGRYHVRPNAQYHGSIADLHHDLGKHAAYGRTNTLLSTKFCYFGVNGSAAYKSKFPAVAQAIARLKQGHRVSHDSKLLRELAQLANSSCSFTQAQLLGEPSQLPQRGVSLRGGACGIACGKSAC